MKKRIYYMLFILMTLVGCKSEETNVIKIGATPMPHADILNYIRPEIQKNGYELDVIVFNDYVTPNLSLQNKDINANYFQHEPYLKDYNKANKTDLVSVFKVHFEPLGIYQGRKSDIRSADKETTIAIPQDESNKKRAMALLIEHGLEESNLIEMDAQLIPMALQDVDFGVVNGNYALSSGIIERVIVTENKNSETAQINGNIIAVRKEDVNKEFVKVLIEAISRKETRDYIETTYGSSVIPLF